MQLGSGFGRRPDFFVIGCDNVGLWHDSDVEWWAEHPLCPGISDVHPLGNRQSVINLDAEITDRALDLGVAE